MRIFLRVFLLFIYLCLTLFTKPSEVFAANNFIHNIPSLNYISETKSEITLSHRIEDYYIVSQNQANTEFSNTSNKNYDLSLVFGEEVFNEDNILRFILFNKNTNHNSRIVHKVSPKLKHAIYTRAP
jgi:hypothetical protein